MSDEVDEAIAKARLARENTSGSCKRGEHSACQGTFARGFNQGHGAPIPIPCACRCHKVAA